MKIGFVFLWHENIQEKKNIIPLFQSVKLALFINKIEEAKIIYSVRPDDKYIKGEIVQQIIENS